MLRAVQVTNHRGEIIYFDLATPVFTGVAIVGIKGLDSVKGDLSFTELASTDGALFNTARATKRNIVFSFVYTGFPVEPLRQLTYRFFPLTKKVTLRFFTDSKTVMTTGYVESNAQDIFSKKAGTSISVVCEGSYLTSTDAAHVEFSALENLFEFPFSNESLTENLIEFGNINLTASRNIVYDGDAPVGVLIHIHATGPAGTIRIRSAKTYGGLTINQTRYSEIVGSSIMLGDVILISTVPARKYARAIRGGVTYNILDAIEYPREWFMLDKGNNLFICDGDNIQNVEFIFYFDVAYEGI